MTQYRKKPVVVQAMRFREDNKEEVLSWVGFAGEPGRDEGNRPILRIDTLEGEMRAVFGDWIIKGVKGEFYPIKDEIFAETYEPVE